MTVQRLLVIENDPETRHLLTSVLAGEGRKVVAAVSGAEAKRHLRAGNVDLVVLELIVEKPFDPDELAADVSVRLGRAARARAAALRGTISAGRRREGRGKMPRKGFGAEARRAAA